MDPKAFCEPKIATGITGINQQQAMFKKDGVSLKFVLNSWLAELTMVNVPDVIRNINPQYHDNKHVEGQRTKPNRWLISLFGKEEEKEEEQGRSKPQESGQYPVN